MHVGAGTLVARDEDQNRSTIPMPTFARRPSTMSSLFPVDIPQNSMVGQQRRQISELQFDKLPTPSSFLYWKITFKNQVTTCSDFPSEAMLWIKEVEMVDSLEESKSSRSIAGKNFPNFEMLEARIASALNKIIQNPPFKKKVSVEEQKAQKKDRFLRGSQIAFMIYVYFRVTGAHDVQYWITLICSLLLFMTIMFRNSTQDGTKVLLSMSKIPSGDVLESLCKLRIRESDQITTVLELYDMEIHHKISMPNCQKLKTMVGRSTDQKLRLRNFDARHGKMETGAVVKNRKGLSGGERGKDFCYQWKEKGQCSKGDQCSSGHESVIMHQNRHRKPLHLLSHQHKEVEVRREKEASKAEVRLAEFFDSRADTI